jgi:glutamate dehydrogenase (NAD(P)+)
MLDEHEVVLTVSDPVFGKLGYLVIDTFYEGHAVGGVRILPDVYLEEISHMARTMTKKYLFTGMACGGAKAGLILKGKAAADRTGALKAFGRALAPYIQNGYFPGCDMGSSIEDIRTIMKNGGYFCLLRNHLPTHKYTAWSVIASTDVALERESVDWKGCRIAIEGFGNVGSCVASMAAEKGAKVVCVSNIIGALYNPDGLDVELMLKLKERHGNSFIKRYKDAEKYPKEKIFPLDCDVFVPCARSWSINSSNVNKIKARFIISAANVPMTIEHERLLWKKGKVIVPDAIANCGGVAGSALATYMSDEEAKSIFDKRFKKRVNDVLDADMAPSEYLEAFCKRRKEELKEAFALHPPKTSLEKLYDRVHYHLINPFFARAKLERSIFPK